MELGYTAKILRMILETISEFVKIRFCLHGSNPGLSSNMYLEVLSFEPLDYIPLTSTPNCIECEYIKERLKADPRDHITDLKTINLIEILENYRGHMLYCSGGLSVYRCDPKTYGGHGYVCMPVSGDEENVYIMTSYATNFKAHVKFVDFVPMNPMMTRTEFEQAMQGETDDISLRVKGIVRV
jgi:hypothetical protein